MLLADSEYHLIACAFLAERSKNKSVDNKKRKEM